MSCFIQYICFFLLVTMLPTCSVLLKDEKEIDKVMEDLLHEELKSGH